MIVLQQNRTPKLYIFKVGCLFSPRVISLLFFFSFQAIFFCNLFVVCASVQIDHYTILLLLCLSNLPTNCASRNDFFYVLHYILLLLLFLSPAFSVYTSLSHPGYDWNAWGICIEHKAYTYMQLCHSVISALGTKNNIQYKRHGTGWAHRCGACASHNRIMNEWCKSMSFIAILATHCGQRMDYGDIVIWVWIFDAHGTLSRCRLPITIMGTVLLCFLLFRWPSMTAV